MFELLYRVLGLVIIFPLTQLLFHLSIRLSGRAYITNATFLDYLLTPSTILILFVVMFMLSIYITIELVYLSIIFEYGHQHKKIKLKELFLTGMKKLYETVIVYRLRIIGPAFLFFILVELFHVVGIASTINFPKVILDQINSSIWFQFGLGLLVVMIVILFTETAFHIHFYVIDKLPTKMTIQESRKLLKGKRLRMMLEFLLLNSALNAVLYVFYMLMILTIGWVVTLIKGQLLTLSVILSIFYSIYIIVGFLATITLICLL
jgi:glycerophosphoryl diester phosphodiesterase